MSYTELGILLLSLAGLLLSIYALKNRDSVTVKPNNPLDHIEGMYILKMPYEKIVIAYFGIMSIVYAISFVANFHSEAFHISELLITSTAFLLFLYKLGLSLTTHAQFSIATLLYAVLNVLIAWLIYSSLTAPIQGLSDVVVYTLTFHLLGLVLGLGGTLILDILIFHFLWNFKIHKAEAVIMHLISQLVIIGLILLLVTGAAIYLTDQQQYIYSGRFLMKMTAVLVLTVNGIVLNFYVMPKIEKLSLLKEEQKKRQPLKRTAFAIGAVSMISWLAAFLFAMVKDLETFSYVTLCIPYVAILIAGVAMSQFFKTKMEKEEASDSLTTKEHD